MVINLENNLGAALALLKKHLDDEIEIDWNEERSSAIKELKQYYSQLKENKDELKYEVPKLQCYSTSVYLKGNIDFFIKHLLLNDDSVQLSLESDNVIKHLNDCYWCFIEYSKIMKEYSTSLIEIENGGIYYAI